jgi:hypothetical protein
MYFQQFYLTCLSHASYMLGSEGVACVVDPQRDVSIYLDEARSGPACCRFPFLMRRRSHGMQRGASSASSSTEAHSLFHLDFRRVA